MNSSKRPNQDGLYKALNIYRDAMRSFIFKSMKSVSGLLAEENGTRSVRSNSGHIDSGHIDAEFKSH